MKMPTYMHVAHTQRRTVDASRATKKKKKALVDNRHRTLSISQPVGYTHVQHMYTCAVGDKKPNANAQLQTLAYASKVQHDFSMTISPISEMHVFVLYSISRRHEPYNQDHAMPVKQCSEIC